MCDCCPCLLSKYFATLNYACILHCRNTRNFTLDVAPLKMSQYSPNLVSIIFLWYRTSSGGSTSSFQKLKNKDHPIVYVVVVG